MNQSIENEIIIFLIFVQTFLFDAFGGERSQSAYQVIQLQLTERIFMNHIYILQLTLRPSVQSLEKYKRLKSCRLVSLCIVCCNELSYNSATILKASVVYKILFQIYLICVGIIF